MSKIKLAVFGHYDSRGGTTGMPLPDQPTEADVIEAVRKYNLAFGLDINDPVSMKRDWPWLTDEPDTTPGHIDFLYVADLHYDGELPKGDLEESGSVVVDAFTQPSSREFATLAAESLDQPVQLEYIPERKNYNTDVTDPEILAQYDAAFPNKDVRTYGFSSQDNKEQKAAREAYNIEMSRLDMEEEARITALAKYISNAQYQRWDDDAYGFIIGTGLED